MIRKQPDGNIHELQSIILLVGLGNPGPRYRDNRHNLGFMVIDQLAESHAINVGRVKQKSVIGDGVIDGHKVILAKPQTFMNRSGEAVQSLLAYFRVNLDRLLVIYDEIDLPLGSVRLRGEGGSGGHNGMRSIIKHLGNDFPRLRLGVGRPPGQMDPADYLLRRFNKVESTEVEILIEEAVLAVETFISQGLELAMSKHNRKR